MQAIEYIEVSKLKTHPNNPRKVDERQMEVLCESIKANPDYFETRPILCNKDMVVFAGNMRLLAAKQIGLEKVPTAIMDISEERQREIMIRDNRQNGVWDFDMLANEFDLKELVDWGFEDKEFFGSAFQSKGDYDDKRFGLLSDRFGAPPFSVLDSRQGYWMERKRSWRDKIGDNGESREGKLASSQNLVGSYNNGVFLLDPVLAELANMWFGIKGGNTFDPFAGDTIFGFVSADMGNNFTGIELREEQVKVNSARVSGMSAKYICDDGQNVGKHIAPESQDLLFSCPPYFDLEVYSDLPNDASNQDSFDDFMKIIDKAFTDAIKCLKPNRFAFIVVGDVRDKNGNYLRFPDRIKDVFTKNGMHVYNELILIEPIGTAALRANNAMKNRKVVKCHQNVLVFFKGDNSTIKSNFEEIKYESQDLEQQPLDDGN